MSCKSPVVHQVASACCSCALFLPTHIQIYLCTGGLTALLQCILCTTLPTSGQTLQHFPWGLDKTAPSQSQHSVLLPLVTWTFYLRWVDRTCVCKSHAEIQKTYTNTRTYTISLFLSICLTYALFLFLPVPTNKTKLHTETHSPESALVLCVIYICADSWGVC